MRAGIEVKCRCLGVSGVKLSSGHDDDAGGVNAFAWKFDIGGALCALIALYFLAATVYAIANFSQFGNSAPHFIRYVLAPALIVAGLGWAATRPDKDLRTMVGINAMAVMAALFAHETYATYGLAKTVAQATSTSETVAAATLNVDGSLPPGTTIRQFNAHLAGGDLKSAALGGVPHRNTLLCFDPVKGPITYVADRFGFNNPDTVYDEGRLDIAVFGDSFVEGHCLEPGADVTSRIRARGVKAASFGFRGNGPLVELAALGRYGPAFRPKTTVVMYYGGNDGANLQRESEASWLRAALDEDANFGEPDWTTQQTETAQNAVAELWASSGIGGSDGFRRRIMRNYFALAQTWSVLGLHYPSAPKRQPIYEDIVGRMKSITQDLGGDLILVYIPRAERFRGLMPNNFVFDADRRIVADVAAHHDVPLVDLAEAFEALGRPTRFYGPDGHFSEEGAEIAAQLVVEKAASVNGGVAMARPKKG